MSVLTRWLVLPFLPQNRLGQVVFSITDQAFSVGGMFVANVALARAASKEEYGMFALVYSVFNFLAGLHNAAILEPYTVHGAGRYNNYNLPYRWLIWRNNALLGLGLTTLLLLVCGALSWIVSAAGSRAIAGLAISSSVLLTTALLRRILYVERKVALAAKLSAVFFLTLLLLLGVLMKFALLNALTVFLAVALASVVGNLVVLGEWPRKTSLGSFCEAEPHHLLEHWRYARWVFATAFVFQLTSQAYYWLVAAFLTLKQVAELRALYMLVMPVDQVFTAISLIVLPMMAARYAAKQISGLLSLWRAYLLTFLLIGVAFVFLVLLTGRSVSHVVYEGKFDNVAPLVGTLALLPVVMGIGSTMNVVMKAAEKPNMVFYAYIASGVATFAVGIPLMIDFGLKGAVYGMLISGGVYTAALGIGFLTLIPRLRSLRVANEQNPVF